MSTRELLTDAIKQAGSEAKLAAAVGRSQVAINKAKRAGRVSAEMAVLLERATSVGRHRWRPDLWPSPSPKEAAE
jgi:DNA-binding transcriptional regulator YdaS (Cro superfamily)